MKRLTLLFSLLFLLAGCTTKKAEQDFNNSGQAKAVIDETDLWPFYEDTAAGFTFKYPPEVTLGNNLDGLSLEVQVDPLETLEGTMGYDKETATKNMNELVGGSFGSEVDFPFADSKKVASLGRIKAQDFLVLGRFEVCDVTFERKLYFFLNDHQVVVTLTAPKSVLLAEIPYFFKTDPANCGEELMWDFEKQSEFYQALVDGEAPTETQKWYDAFDQITKTISLNNLN